MSFVEDRIAMEGLTFDDVLLIPAYSEVLHSWTWHTDRFDYKSSR